MRYLTEQEIHSDFVAGGETADGQAAPLPDITNLPSINVTPTQSEVAAAWDPMPLIVSGTACLGGTAVAVDSAGLSALGTGVATAGACADALKNYASAPLGRVGNTNPLFMVGGLGPAPAGMYRQ